MYDNDRGSPTSDQALKMEVDEVKRTTGSTKRVFVIRPAIVLPSGEPAVTMLARLSYRLFPRRTAISYQVRLAMTMRNDS